MASHKITYMDPSLLEALKKCDEPVIRHHLKEPNGAIAQAYLHSCIEYAASLNNLPLLRLLFTMLSSDPEPMVALQTWPLEAFKELISFLEKNNKLLTIYSLSAYTINEYMERLYVNYDNLHVLLTSAIGSSLVEKLAEPKNEKSKLFLADVKSELQADPTEESCYDRAVATGHTCINPYCADCK